MRRRASTDGTHEILAGHLDERNQLYVLDRDGVEGDIYAPRSLHHLAEVSVNRLLVQSVDLRRLGHSPSRGYVLRDLVERCDSASCEKDPGSLAGESTGHRAAYFSSTPVDYSVLPFEQHVYPPVCWIPGRPETYAASQSAESTWSSSSVWGSGCSTVTATAIATTTSPAPIPNARW
jgi:hypothetical protein